MKLSLLPVLLAGSLLFSICAPGVAAEVGEAAKELEALVTKIKAKLGAGDRTEAKLADELKEFDVLLAKHQGEKTDDVAQILALQATLYSQVLNNPEKGKELEARLKKDFPDTKAVAALKKQEEGEKIRNSLVEGAKFPEFEEQDLQGKPLKLASYRGKVVLVDFWATWCGPCVGELPNVLASYQKHHDAGFEIVGISLDSKREKLEQFIQEKKMPWQQFFDGQGWNNKLAGQYGVTSIPATYLLDGEGKIIAKNLRGEALEAAVAKALTK